MASVSPPEDGEEPPNETNVISPSMRQDLESLNELLDSSTIEEDLQELATVQAAGKQTFLFLDEDEEFQKVLAQGGPNPSLRVDQWAINRLTAFRKFKGWDTTVEFNELPPRELNALLCKFFEQVCKLDGTLYPTETLQSLYRAFHRVMSKRQAARILSTGVEEVKVSLKESATLGQVGIACVTAMHKSRNAGANLPRKKASVISMEDEKVILNDACTSPSNSRGLQKRAAYYLLSRFCIRGGSELYSLPSECFSFGENVTGKFVRFDERLSKNYKVTMERFQEEHFRPAIVEYEQDIVETLEKLIKHLLATVSTPVKYMFYQAIDSPRSIAWFSTLHVSQRNLNKWMKIMFDECGLISDGVTNKSGRTTCLTRMAVEGVPPAVGMLLTGHKSQGAYSRYDRSTDAKVLAAQKAVSAGAAFDETFKNENAKLKQSVVQGKQEGKKKARTEWDPMFEGVYVGDDDDSLVTKNGADRDGSQAKKPTANGKDAPEASVHANTDSQVSEDTNTCNNSLTEQTTRQTIEEFDKWADSVNWDAVDGDLMKRGFLGRNVQINPINNATFGRIGQMSNSWSHCHVSINIGGGRELSGEAMAKVVGIDTQ